LVKTIWRIKTQGNPPPRWRERRARAPHVCASLRQAGLHPLNEYHILDMIKMPRLGTHKVHSTWLPTVSHDPIYKSLHPIKIEMQRILIGAILLSPIIGFGQNEMVENWTENDTAQYSNLKELARYVYKKEKSEISKDSLFAKYIFFDNILNDTVSERREGRVAVFNNLFDYFRKTIDSIGWENLDAKPLRFYKNHKIYEPFDEDKAKLKALGGEKMYAKDDNVFAYFRKEEPENPLGVLLFESETDKLAAWIMINQGGYGYFLTFNLF